jgi:hypothetical protein
VTPFVGAALAAPGTERGAWPSLPLEQPVVMPRGWTLLSAGAVRATDVVGARADLRSGVAGGLELAVASGIDAPPDGGPVRLRAPALEGRVGLGRREGPSASAAAVAALVPPWSGSGPSLTGGLAGAAVTAPLRWSVEAGATWSPGAVNDAVLPWIRGQALAQVGPLAGWAGAAFGPDAVATLGAQLNASRGLAAWAALRRAVLRRDPRSGEGDRTLEAGVRVAF